MDTTRLVATRANGRPAVIVCRRALDGREERFCVMTLEVDGDRIAGFDGFLDPQLVRVFEGPGSQALGPRHRAG